jgi:hypothetical protein
MITDLMLECVVPQVLPGSGEPALPSGSGNKLALHDQL